MNINTSIHLAALVISLGLTLWIAQIKRTNSFLRAIIRQQTAPKIYLDSLWGFLRKTTTALQIELVESNSKQQKIKKIIPTQFFKFLISHPIKKIVYRETTKNQEHDTIELYLYLENKNQINTEAIEKINQELGARIILKGEKNESNSHI